MQDVSDYSINVYAGYDSATLAYSDAFASIPYDSEYDRCAGGLNSIH